MTFETVTYEKTARAGVLTLNAPERLNALTELQMSEIEQVLDQVAADQSLGAFILTGAGNAFCVGVHFEMLDRAFEDIDYFESIVRRVSGIAARIEALAIPTIAALNGVTRAAGFEISLGCDFVLMADEARCGDVHTNVAVLPGAGALRLARRVGEQRAKELIWTARWWSAQEAVANGLAWKAAPRARLREEALAFAATMTDKSRPVIEASKRVFQRGADLTHEEGVELELRSFVAYMGSHTAPREGYLSARAAIAAKKT